MRQKISFEAADGRVLAACWWPGDRAAERSVVFLPGLAAPQEYLQFFASYLAKCGWGVLTFDYRSVGSSRQDGDDERVTIDEWIDLDLPAAVAEVKRRANPQFLAVVAHSIGGQLLGQSPIRHEVNGALFISAQRGIPRLYSGYSRFRVEFAYAVFPLLIRALGYLPISRVTLPTPCSGLAVRQWVKWGRSGVFTDRHGKEREAGFAEFQGALTAVTIADDKDYAPAESVEALTSMYRNARLRREIVDSRDYGLAAIGHFGFFHRHTPRELWAQVESWLREDNAR